MSSLFNKIARQALSNFTGSESDTSFPQSGTTLGTFGDVVFSVGMNGSQIEAFTFDGFSRDGKANYAKHNVHGKKQLLEFTGLEADAISFSVRLDVALGIDPIEQIKRFKQIKDDCIVGALIIGGYVFGEFVLDDFKENWKQIDGKGRLTVAIIDLKLTEYIKNVK